MKKLLAVLILVTSGTYSATLKPVEGDFIYTTSEGRIIEELTGKKPESQENKNKFEQYKDLFLNKKKTYVPNLERKEKFNEMFSLKRDDKQVLNVKMSPNDVVDLSMCFQTALRISIGKTINEEIMDVVVDDTAFLSTAMIKDNKSVIVKMKMPIKEDGVWRTGLRVLTAKTSASYNFNIALERCPEGELNYPKEIIVEKLNTFSGFSDRVLVAEDLITEASKGYPRQNSENIIDVYDGIISPNAEYAVLGVAVKVGDPKKYKAKLEFVVLDALQTRILESKAEYLPISSQKITNDTSHPTLRFNLTVKSNGFPSMKRYISERNYIYMMVIDHGSKYYQYVKIPLKQLMERKKIEGWEIN